ncbi:MAG: hypothetical protein QXJ56_00055 [Ignisphaera sp.]
MAKDIIQLLELRKDIIDPYKTSMHIYLTDRVALLRLRGTYLISHPFIAYSYNGFPFISSAPFVYRYRDSINAYNTVMDQYALDPLRIDYSDCRVYPLNISSAIVTNFDNIPLSIISSSIDRGLEVKPIDGIATGVDVYPIGFENRVVFLDGNRNQKIYKMVVKDTDIEFIEHCYCDSLSALRHNHYKALVCFNSNTEASVLISDGLYGIEFPLDRDISISSNAILYLYSNIAYIELSNNGVIAYYKNGLCNTIEFNRHLKPLALLSNNSILGFAKNFLTLYSIDEKREFSLISTRLEDVYNVSVDPHRNLALLSTSKGIYIFDLDNLSFVMIPSSRRVLGYISGDYMVLLRGDSIEIYFIEMGSSIHLERILSSHSYIARCSSIGKGIITCIDRIGRIAFIDLRYIDRYIDRHPHLLRDVSTNVSVALPDAALHTPLKFEGYRELPYSIHRVDSLRSIATIAIDSRFGNSDTFSLGIQGLLREYRVSISRNRKIEVHSKRPPEIQLHKMYIVNREASSSIVIPPKSLGEAINGKTFLLVKEGGIVRGVFKNGIVKFDVDSRISANDSIYVAKEVGNAILGQMIKSSYINIIDMDSIVNTISNAKGGNVSICIDTAPLERADMELSSIEVICSNRVIRSSSSCTDISPCNDILAILVEVALDRQRKDTTTILLQYNRKFYTEFTEGLNLQLSKDPHLRVRIPHRCMYNDNTHLRYNNGLKIHVNIINRCTDLPIHIISQDSLHRIEPGKALRLELPFNLDEIIKGYTNFIVIEPGSMKLIRIDIPLKNLILYTNRIALKIATLLGIRSSVQKHSHGSSPD